MKSRQLYFVLLTVTAILSLGLIGAGIGADKILTAKANQLNNLKAQSQTIEQVQANLSKSKADLTRYKELDTIAKAIVPQDKDQTQTVREIVKIANDNGITNIASITFPVSTLGNTIGGTGMVSQVVPVKGLSGVYILPITVTVNDSGAVNYDQFINFLRGLEQNRRTSQVANLTLKPNQKDPNKVSFVIVINEYIKP